MAAFSMKVACRGLVGRGVWRLSEVAERQYHRCPITLHLHRPRAFGTHQQLVLMNVRYQSTAIKAASQVPVIAEAHIPTTHPTPEAVLPLTVSEVTPTVPETLGQVEQGLAELGLAGHSPTGLVQNILEFLHVDIGLPWWGAIVSATLVARILIFPLIVKGQREAAKLNNHMPQITVMTTRMNEAKQSGNKFEFSKAYTELTLYQKKHDVNPLRGFLVPLVQMPVFISFFVALRQMAYLPVPSMQTGGLWWFTDLTIADPIYVLPVVVTCSMLAVIELGAEFGVNNPQLAIMKNVMRIMPLTIFAFTIHFPTAVFMYWATSNFFSIAQVALLKIPTVRKKLNIPEKIQHDPSTLPKQEGFIKSLKKGWSNAQVAKQLEEREYRIKNHLDIAAKGPLRQTFSQNPLQERKKILVSAKKSKPWQDTIG
ncbi:mitochondrial inner membrane protein OXA1L [Pseudophryne corroboree]|uniref:mitochondrial inner membrane protein OXA1L n=1 Tax=Pseudophryne corroboree TaxID=495146 RepID=UPI003081D0AE